MPVADAGDLVRSVGLLPPQAGGDAGMFVEQYLASAETRRTSVSAVTFRSRALVSSGEISHLAVTGRFPTAEPFRETGFFIPALVAGPTEAVLEVATAAVRALGLETGDSHTEIKLTPEGPRVLEVNGGSVEAYPRCWSRQAVCRSLSCQCAWPSARRSSWLAPVPCDKVGWRFLFQPPVSAKRVVSIDGLDRLAALPGVNDIFVNRSPGDPIDWREGTRHYIYSVYGVSRTTRSCSRSTVSCTRKCRSFTSEDGPDRGAVSGVADCSRPGADGSAQDLLDAVLGVEEGPQAALRRRHVMGEVPHALGEGPEQPDSSLPALPRHRSDGNPRSGQRCRPPSRRSRGAEASRPARGSSAGRSSSATTVGFSRCPWMSQFTCFGVRLFEVPRAQQESRGPGPARPRATARRAHVTMSASMSARSCLERSAGGPATMRLTLVLMLSRKSR